MKTQSNEYLKLIVSDLRRRDAKVLKQHPPGCLHHGWRPTEIKLHLLQGGVFSEDLITTWIEYKRDHELRPIQMRPHPYEFYLYSDV